MALAQLIVRRCGLRAAFATYLARMDASQRPTSSSNSHDSAPMAPSRGDCCAVTWTLSLPLRPASPATAAEVLLTVSSTGASPFFLIGVNEARTAVAGSAPVGMSAPPVSPTCSMSSSAKVWPERAHCWKACVGRKGQTCVAGITPSGLTQANARLLADCPSRCDSASSTCTHVAATGISPPPSALP